MIRLALTLAAAGLALPAAAQVHTYGKETSIDFATGGIREFEQGPEGSNIVYLQDRTLRWYQVTLTGPCFPNQTQDTAIYRASPNGRFDRFSSIASSRFPSRICGVTSILRSDAPPNRPKVRVPTARELQRQPG